MGCDSGVLNGKAVATWLHLSTMPEPARWCQGKGGITWHVPNRTPHLPFPFGCGMQRAQEGWKSPGELRMVALPLEVPGMWGMIRVLLCHPSFSRGDNRLRWILLHGKKLGKIHNRCAEMSGLMKLNSRLSRLIQHLHFSNFSNFPDFGSGFNEHIIPCFPDEECGFQKAPSMQ